MLDKNKIIRVKKIYNMYDKDREYYEFIFMSFGDFCESEQFVFVGEKTELAPFKWYEIQRFWKRLSYKAKKKNHAVNLLKISGWLNMISIVGRLITLLINKR